MRILNTKLSNSSDLYRGLINFCIKTIIITTAIIFSIISIIPDISALPRIPETQKSKLLILGLIQNPYIFLEISKIEEEKGNIKNAIFYIEASIGLLELHGVQEVVMNKYKNKLKILKDKL